VRAARGRIRVPLRIRGRVERGRVVRRPAPARSSAGSRRPPSSREVVCRRHPGEKTTPRRSRARPGRSAAGCRAGARRCVARDRKVRTPLRAPAGVSGGWERDLSWPSASDRTDSRVSPRRCRPTRLYRSSARWYSRSHPRSPPRRRLRLDGCPGRSRSSRPSAAAARAGDERADGRRRGAGRLPGARPREALPADELVVSRGRETQLSGHVRR
jgi:hypothetical protein